MRRPSSRAEAAQTVRGSRFLAVLLPVSDRQSAEAALVSVSEAGPDATHHCWAYRVWSPTGIEGVGFDAGEPSGTAGRPILGALERADVVGAACVVSRWFGGTKLGTGGLVRAYGNAARAAIEAAKLEPVDVWARFEVTFPYASTAAVRRVVSSFGARERSGSYGESVGLVLAVPDERSSAFEAALREVGSGVAEVTALEPVMLGGA